jgi:DNA-binding transcriptional LysR family regulator
MLDLYKLRIFITVAQAGSFSRAAEQLYMTQSAVSQHIKELETSLGVTLFERGWRGVKLTPRGETLQDYARQIFALVAQAENALTDVQQMAAGRVSIGATPGIAVYLAPDWVQRFRGIYPQITVALETGVTGQVVTQVLGRHIDLGFIEGELDSFEHPRLASRELAEVEQMVVVGFKHPLWDRTAIPIEAIDHQSFIVRPAHTQSRIWLEKTLRQHQVEPLIGAEFDNLEAIKRAVTAGRCLAVLPPYVFQSEREQGLLHAIPIEGRPLVRTLKVIWDAEAYFSPVTRAFLGTLASDYSALSDMAELNGVAGK